MLHTSTDLRARCLFALLCLLPLLAAVSARSVGYGASGLGLCVFIEALCCRRPVLLTVLRPWRGKHLTMSGWLLLISMLCFLSTLWALDPHITFDRALKVAPQFLGGAALIMVAPAIARAATVQDRQRWLLAYALTLIIIIADMLSGMKLHHLLYRGETGPAMQVDGLNRSVLCCVLFFMPALGFIFSQTAAARRNKWLQVILIIALLLLTLRSTGSQSAQLAFGLTLVAFIFPVRSKIIWRAVAVLAAILILSAPWLSQFLMHDVAPALPSMPFFGRGQGYAANRIEIWDYISRYALQRPLIGFGMDATRAVPAFDSKQIYQKGLTIPHPHNFAVQLWMEFGVIGAIIGAGLIAAILQYLSTRPIMFARRLGLGAFLAGLSCAAMTYSLWQGWWFGLLFLTAALIRLVVTFYEDGEARGSNNQA